MAIVNPAPKRFACFYGYRENSRPIGLNLYKLLHTLSTITIPDAAFLAVRLCSHMVCSTIGFLNNSCRLSWTSHLIAIRDVTCHMGSQCYTCHPTQVEM